MRSSSRRPDAGVARRELIGLEVAVVSAHGGWDGLSGRIVDETKNTFLVEGPDGLKRVPKTGNRFLFRAGDGGFVVPIEGDDIAFRPEDRTKKVRG